ncbi:MAG TPA: hypothetical protein VHT95_12205 [Vicinamibacterales bacterium]|nr:hypothetical protein [Vicinamibacterales bacterium]
MLVVSAFACLTVIATFPLLFHLGRALPGDLGDPLFTSWVLGWDADRLLHGLRGFWDAPILFPSRHTMAFSEHMLGIAVFVAPIVWLTGNPILGYGVAFLLTYVLAGCGMYLLARALTGRRDAAFLAGLMFAFSPLRALHVSHLQVLAWGWMPIALWGLHRFMATLKASPRLPAAWLAVFVAAFTIEALSNGYFLYYLTIASAFVVTGELARRSMSGAERLRTIGSLAVAAACILACIAAVAAAYLSVRRQYGFVRPYDDWTIFSANVRSYVSAPLNARVLAPWLRGDSFPERQLFPGLVILAASAAALWPGGERRRMTILYAALAATAFLLSLGPEPAAWSHRLPWGPYLWIARALPGMDGLRVPARLSVIVLMALCVLAALGLTRLLTQLRPGARAIAAILIGLAVFAEGWSGPVRMAPVDARGRPGDRGAHRWLAQQTPGGAIELPIVEWAIAPTLTYQYATLAHDHPIVNGYSGYGSALQEFLGGGASPLNDLERMEDSLNLLRAVGVRYVLVHPRDYDDPSLGAATIVAIRARGDLASEAFRSDDVVAFRLRDADPPPALPAAGRRLPSGAFRADASDAADRVPFLFDGDGDTRWLTGRPQNGDEWIRIAFDRVRDVSRFELQTASRSFGDYPRDLTVESVGEDGMRSVLYQGAMLTLYGRALARGGTSPAIVVGLPSNHTRTLIIRQTGRSRRWFWAVHELAIFER